MKLIKQTMRYGLRSGTEMGRDVIVTHGSIQVDSRSRTGEEIAEDLEVAAFHT